MARRSLFLTCSNSDRSEFIVQYKIALDICDGKVKLLGSLLAIFFARMVPVVEEKTRLNVQGITGNYMIDTIRTAGILLYHYQMF